jgi:ParB family chromosome partitioning protein
LAKDEQAFWDQVWAVHTRRYAAEVTAARQQAQEHPRPPSQYSPAQLQQLAFGAYVGLVREQGGAANRKQRAALGPEIIRVRQTALSRILALATGDPQYAKAAQPVLVQALGDPNQAVRMQAFEHLQALGMDRTTLGAEALETGHTDLGVRGLELLSGGAAAKQGQAVLEQVMLSRTDDLALEAAKLLKEPRGAVAVATQALNAAHERLRGQAVAWLAAEYDKDKSAQKPLRQALDSRYQKVREAAALELATKKDPAAFEALVKLLMSAQDANKQGAAIKALVTLGDPRSPDVFLDRLENDPSGTALVDVLLKAVGDFRRPQSVDRLLAIMEKHYDRRGTAFDAVLTISGHDQGIDDPDDEQPDRSWEEKQHPRHDAILARLMERCFSFGEPRFLRRLVPRARWARGKEVEPVLSLLITHSDDQLRQEAVEALGWRLRKRKGGTDALRKALQHKDSLTQFLAAEGLALGSRPEGLNVLLASIDFLSDLTLRRRAVRALGELADARALDLLLRLAGEDGHALQEEAAEAIGHLGRSDKAEEIFKLLERFAKSDASVAENALKGLRWLNTHAGWQLIRQRAEEVDFSYPETAVEMLGYNDDPATRDLLLRLLKDEENWNVTLVALGSARRLWGPESLEPDYAFLQNKEVGYSAEEELQDSVSRVCARGEPKRIFEILPGCEKDVQDTLAANLLNRVPLPIAEAQSAIGGTDERTVQLSAHILGRADAQAA